MKQKSESQFWLVEVGTATSEIKTMLADTIIVKTSRSLPKCNDIAVTIVSGRIEQFSKAEGEESKPY